MQGKNIKAVSYFLGGMLILAVLAFFRGEFSGDTVFNRCKLQPQQKSECVVDLAEQGIVKYWLQPEVLSLHFSCLTENKLPLTCEVKGFPRSYLTQGSKKKGNWYEILPNQILVRRGKSQSMQVNVEVGVPKDSVNRRHVADGEIIFYHQGQFYSSIAIHIINSKYQG